MPILKHTDYTNHDFWNPHLVGTVVFKFARSFLCRVIDALEPTRVQVSVGLRKGSIRSGFRGFSLRSGSLQGCFSGTNQVFGDDCQSPGFKTGPLKINVECYGGVQKASLGLEKRSWYQPTCYRTRMPHSLCT